MRKIIILMVLLLCLTYSKNAIAQELQELNPEYIFIPPQEIQLPTTNLDTSITVVPTIAPTKSPDTFYPDYDQPEIQTPTPTPIPTLSPTMTPVITPVPTPYPTYQPVLIITPRPTVYPTTSASPEIKATESAEEVFGTASAAIENYFPEEVIDDFWHMVKIVTASGLMTLILTKRMVRIKKRSIYKSIKVKSGKRSKRKKQMSKEEKNRSKSLLLSIPGIDDIYELYCDSKDVWEERKETD